MDFVNLHRDKLKKFLETLPSLTDEELLSVTMYHHACMSYIHDYVELLRELKEVCNEDPYLFEQARETLRDSFMQKIQEGDFLSLFPEEEEEKEQPKKKTGTVNITDIQKNGYIYPIEGNG